jgi:hypothetical protein
MQFSVIYSVDVPGRNCISRFAPPQVRSRWQLTEGDESYEYGYLEGRWERGKHRKWYAVLTKEQFSDFVQRCGLYAENVETLGSLGSPGLGWSPAISFTSDDDDAFVSAYVTPIPETTKTHRDERDWKRLRRAVLRTFS